MLQDEQKYSGWRLRGSYLITVISISLVLFLLGLIGILVLNARELSKYVKENIGFAVILHDNLKDVEIRRLQKELDASDYVKETEYIGKKRAAEELKKELGEDFVEFLGYNPLKSSIDVRLKAGYANTDSIAKIKKEMEQFPQIFDIFYQKSLVHLVNENVRKFSFFLLVLSILLLVIAYALINNTIRLSIYARRFTINTMKLVGATKGFIRKPFLINSLIYGMAGAIIAIVLLIIVISTGQQQLEVIIIKNSTFLFLMEIITGVIFSVSATYFALNRYMKLSSSELYY